ncbi:tumor necrosis factor ligand superfamily member 13 [Amia ocellicauda]|uniref:tumor necrosis factor ligand superfamily member 13 n=1 Tax=Amia ocellicauda TaxID=2972642 RepID=UPI003463D734
MKSVLETKPPPLMSSSSRGRDRHIQLFVSVLPGIAAAMSGSAGRGRGGGSGVGSAFEALSPVLFCAVSLAVLYCCSVLLGQSVQIQNLQGKLSEMQKRVETDPGDGVAATGRTEPTGRGSCEPDRCPPSLGSEVREEGGGLHEREKRQTEKCRKNVESRARGPLGSQGSSSVVRRLSRRSVLHLKPLATRSDEEQDSTVLVWGCGYGRGRGLELAGETVTVREGGLYFLYSQGLYQDNTFTMGHVVKKRLHGNETTLLRCVKSMPSDPSLAYNTCYTAGVQFLESGSVLEMSVPRNHAGVSLQPHNTYMGLYSI